MVSVQKMLGAILGAKIVGDGYFGTKLERLVMEFQEKTELCIDGVVSPPVGWRILEEFSKLATDDSVTKTPSIH